MPVHGNVMITDASNGLFCYTPNANADQTDQFVFVAKDYGKSSNMGIVTLKIQSQNDAPQAMNDQWTATEDMILETQLSAMDIDSDPLTYSIVKQGSLGQAILVDSSTGEIKYQPKPDINGLDRIQFQVSDGRLQSNIAEIVIQIQGLNDAPSAYSSTFETGRGQALAITLLASDLENDPLDYQIVSPPAAGILTSITGAIYHYQPDSDFIGKDQLTFQVSDGEYTSNKAIVSIIIGTINAVTDEEKAITLNIVSGANIIENVSHGTTKWMDQQLIYTPAKDFVGYDTIRYQNPGDPVIREIVIRIEPVNDAPVIHEIDTLSVIEDESLSIPIVIEEPDGDPITMTYTSPDHGIIVESPPLLSYYPDENFHGSDQFIVHVTDGTFEVTQEINITVISKNDIPVIGSLQTVEVMEDHAVDITIAATDVDHDALELQIVEQANHGQIQGKTLDMMHLNYSPSPNYEGWDYFSIRIFDGLAHSETKQISIHVLGVNDLPTANSKAINGIENTKIIAQLEGFDIEGQTLVYQIFAQAENGLVSITPSTGECVYMPSQGFVGQDEFSFTVNDGYTGSAPATVIIRVEMGNRAPVAENGILEIIEDESGFYTLTATDIHNDPLTFTIEKQPIQGQVQIIDAQTGFCQYIPSTDKNGTDLFTFIVSDGVLDSSIATITVKIMPVNDRPLAQDSNLRLDEDFEKLGKLNGSDIDGDDFTYEIVKNPDKGVLELIDPQNGNYRYSSFLDYHGTDMFQFIVRDAESTSLTGTVNIVIDSINDAPTATSLTIETLEDRPISGIFQGADVDKDPLYFMLVDNPNALSNGILEIKDAITGEFTYYPPENQYGQFVFNYYVSDGQLSSSPAALTIHVQAANDAPVVFDQNLSTDINETLIINLSGYDIDEDSLSYQIMLPPTNGDLIKEGDHWKYIPKTDFQGVNFFTYQADDQSGSDTAKSNMGTINIRVGVPEADFFTYEDNKMSFDLLSGTSFDSEVLQYEIIDSPDHGLLKGEGQFQTYEPDANYSEMDNFTVRYTLATQTFDRDIQIYIIPVNDPPKLTGVDPLPAFTYEDQALSLTILVLDPDTSLESLSFSVKNPPENGQAIIMGNVLSYQPSKDFSGDDQLTVSVTDGFEDSSSSQVIDIKIVPANDVPIAFDDSVETLEETQLTINPMAFDQDADTLVYTIKQKPQNGSLSGQSPSFTYVPHSNFYGKDRLTFVASDGESMSDEAEIIIHVRNVNDAPKANSASFVAHDGNQVSGRLLALDPDLDILIFSLVKRPEKGLLTFINPVMGTFIYYPHSNESGIDTFSFKVNDGSKDSNHASVSITLDSTTTENQFANVIVTISEPYAPYVNACTYMFIDADSGQMIVNGSTLKDSIDATLPKGNYRLILLAPNYKPYEYQEKDKQKYFILDDDMDFSVTLTPQESFNPHPAGVDISYMITPNGIKIWAVKKNLDASDQFYMHIQTRSGEIPVDHADTSGDGSSNAPYTYYWTPSSPWSSYEYSRYEIKCIFYGGAYGHAKQLDSITFQWYENQNRKRSISNTDAITYEFGQSPMYISQGDSDFYPLAGTDCHTTLMDNNGIERHMTVHIPPIPLEYLYIDDSYGYNGGQLNYDRQSDRFHPDPFQAIQTVASDQKLRAEINYYTFGKGKAGNGISLSFYIAEGELEGKPVRYNPILMSDSSRMSNAPTIVLPVYLNLNASVLSGVSNLQEITPEVRIYEAGDGVDGFRTEKLKTTVENDGLVFIEMNHLTMVGLDVLTSDTPTPSSGSDDSSSGCFIDGLEIQGLRWHEILGFIIICFLIGLILFIKNDARSS